MSATNPTRRWAIPSIAGLLAAALTACAPAIDGKGALAPRLPEVPLEGPGDVAIDGNTAYVVDMGHNTIRRLDLSTRRLTAFPRTEGLHGPFHVAVEADHSVIATDIDRVVRISPEDGRVTTLATERQLKTVGKGIGMLSAIVADPRGGVYVGGHDYIVRIDDSKVSHVGGGTGKTGYQEGSSFGDGGPAAVAGFAFVADLLADPAGNLYVAQFSDYNGDDRIRRIDVATGIVTTVVGPDTRVLSRTDANDYAIENPQNLAWDAQGHLLVSEGSRILRVDLARGDVRVVSTHPGNGLAVAPDGALIVGDYLLNRVRRIDLRTDRIRSIAGRGRRIPRGVQL